MKFGQILTAALPVFVGVLGALVVAEGVKKRLGA